jgi:HlyD family secretion protein
VKKRKAAALVLVAGVAIGGAFLAGRWYRADRGPEALPGGLTAYGNVDIRQVGLAFRVEGRLREVAFEEGDEVRTGDLVAVLDPEPFEEELALGRAELSAVEADLERLRNGYRPQEIETARAAVAEREVTLANLQREFDRRRPLVRDGAVTRQSFDDIQARRDEARARLESARQELALREEGFRREEIDRALAQVASRKARLEIARTRLDDTRLLAPGSGTVLTRVLEPGSIARIGQTVLTLSLADPVWVRAYVPEPDLGRIHPGMKALVFTDSRPDRPYEGRIGFISPEAEFTPKNVETPDLRTRLVFRFRVVVENPDEGLRQGMPVTVRLSPRDTAPP